jgi:hypothetical protein
MGRRLGASKQLVQRWGTFIFSVEIFGQGREEAHGCLTI